MFEKYYNVVFSFCILIRLSTGAKSEPLPLIMFLKTPDCTRYRGVYRLSWLLNVNVPREPAEVDALAVYGRFRNGCSLCMPWLKLLTFGA